MPRRLRYTGRFPPRALWDRFPNWSLALDEEGLRGQDETTLKPSAQQETIDRSVTWTAGEVQLADGRRRFAALCVLDGELDTVSFQEGRAWREVRKVLTAGWEPSPLGGLRADDRSVFPLRVTSRLPLRAKGRPIAAVLRPNARRLAALARQRAALAKELVAEVKRYLPRSLRERH